MIDGTLVVMVLGFLGTIGVIVWSEHRQARLLSARIEELKTDHEKDIDGLKVDQQNAVAELKADQQNAVAELKADQQNAVAELKVDQQNAVAELKMDQQNAVVELKADQQNAVAELKAEMRTQDERHRVLEGKVDRIQGSLDVLIHAYRHDPLAQPTEERQVTESPAN